MDHISILPVIVPAILGVIMLMPSLAKSMMLQRWLGFIGVVALVVISVLLLKAVSHETQVYVLGGWQPPFGIILLADRLSALLVALTSFLALCALMYSTAKDDSTGRFFYPLFMFQLMGINGAFLTGDAFNLFVFFEVLLIASYALLLHGGGKAKTAASVHYVLTNLVGSAFFLLALGTLYGTLGTLNIADMAARMPYLTAEQQTLAKAGGLLLLLVFGIKSAMLPLQFWLTQTYSAASAPVAALFAIMTKVGIYSIYRVFGSVFGEQAGDLAYMASAWIWPMAIGTIILGAIGVLAAPSLRMLTSNVVLISAGTLLLSFVINQGQSLSAGLYYLIHSTLVTGALFLIADQIAVQRGAAQDRFVVSKPMNQAPLLSGLFMLCAIAAVGLPPLSGFIGKAYILASVTNSSEQVWVWGTVLVASLMALIAFGRAGTAMFWHLSGNKPGKEKATPIQIAAIALLLLATPLLTIFAGPVTEFTEQAAADLYSSSAVIQHVIENSDGVSHGH
ncbi:monovalent cation/H+ antiporter subunit D [Reinekea forsetii]|nr:monovalent cation/H+ antiporter subunit D [Reinekea forsetii]